MKPFRKLVLMLAAGALAATTLAGEAELGIDAPALKVSDWVKGKAVDLKDGKGKNVYVVEFWATWCKPCKRSIPHLTEMQKKYADKNVVFVGITNETDKADKVREFVKAQGDKMDYVVAIDTAPGDKSGADKSDEKAGSGDRPEGPLTSVAYMDTFGMDGIPCAFIINKEGKVVYVGNPVDKGDKFDESLAQIVDGKWDLAAANTRLKNQRAAEKLTNTYFHTVIEGGDAAAAKQAADEFMKVAEKNSQALNQFAWILLTAPRIKNRDMDLAVKVSKAAYDSCDGKNGEIVDTYAKALFDTGKVSEAIKYEKKAIELCAADEDAEVVAELKETLKKYEAAEKKE